MKILLALSLCLFLVIGINAYSQDDEEEYNPLKFFKERYEEKYNEPYEVMWRAIKLSLQDVDCLIAMENNQQNDNGLYQGVIRSDFCVLASGTDTTSDVLKRYSLEMPAIMGASWENGRIQYTYSLKELEDGSCTLVLRTELSGREGFVTTEVHFWKSNGILEHEMFELIKKNIPKAKSEKN
jgi:hypothetical protein